MRSVRDVEVRGKRVVLRADLNEPISVDGTVTDIFRLERALMTIEYLSSCGAKIIIISHLGRNGNTLAPIAMALAKITTIPISFCAEPFNDENCRNAVATLRNGECILLENIRRESGEDANDSEFAEQIALYGDVFVNDAFADSHRAHASIVGVTEFLPSYAGLLMEEEVRNLSQAVTPPANSIAILGGAKWETKLQLIRALLERYSLVCIGGALANDLLRARGYAVGISVISNFVLPEDLVHNENLIAPVDLLVTSSRGERQCDVKDVSENERIVDIGKQTVKVWGESITQAPFVVWNGPLGIYEGGHVEGTQGIAKALELAKGNSVIGGGDTLAAIRAIGFKSYDHSNIFLSTGGGAMLQFIADGTLPGIEPLCVIGRP